jgi:hypothetical protein
VDADAASDVKGLEVVRHLAGAAIGSRALSAMRMRNHHKVALRALVHSWRCLSYGSCCMHTMDGVLKWPIGSASA